ncbi:MAG: hypothetical protein HY231_20680 [Acidobacteria bacterium]|nr:hypothetical protein [Acidobacteriota bacterium]
MENHSSLALDFIHNPKSFIKQGAQAIAASLLARLAATANQALDLEKRQSLQVGKSSQAKPFAAGVFFRMLYSKSQRCAMG